MKLGIRGKFLVILISISALHPLVLGGSTFILFSRQAKEIQNERLDSDLKSLMALAAQMIEAEDVLALADNTDESNPLYDTVRGQLAELSTANPLIAPNRIFIAVRGERPGEVIVVVDSEEDDQQRFVSGEVYEPDTEFEKLLDGFEEAQIDEFFDEDEEGLIFVTGYGPLYDAAGEAVAVIAVNLQAESVFDVQADVFRSYSIALLALGPVVIGISLITAKRAIDPVDAITDAAEVVERGETFEPAMLEKVAGRSDELGRLAQIFSKMAVEIQAREKKMKQEMQELKIQIDLVKANEQVAEITGSDFFKELKEQARTMRKKSEEEAG